MCHCVIFNSRKGVIMKISSVRSKAVVTGIVTLFMFWVPIISWADFFKYKDNSGSIVITNRLEDVPKQYQNRVKVIWDKELEAKDPLARRQAAAREQYEQRERQEADRQVLQEAKKKKQAKKGQTLVIEMDDATGEIKRRFE